MFDMSWGEVMVIGAVALIVIGPKDLPKALRTVGQATAKVRRMAAEFQSQFNDAMRDAELDEARKEIDDIHRTITATPSFNPIETIRTELKGAVEGQPSAPVPPPVEPPVPESLPPAAVDTARAASGETIILPLSPEPPVAAAESNKGAPA